MDSHRLAEALLALGVVCGVLAVALTAYGLVQLARLTWDIWHVAQRNIAERRRT